MREIESSSRRRGRCRPPRVLGVGPADGAGRGPKEVAMTAPTTPARRLRRYTCGAALILFPALLVVQGPIDPTTGGSADALYIAATRQSGALLASALLLLVSGMLMAPAAAGILHQARDRGAALA